MYLKTAYLKLCKRTVKENLCGAHSKVIIMNRLTSCMHKELAGKKTDVAKLQDHFSKIKLL